MNSAVSSTATTWNPQGGMRSYTSSRSDGEERRQPAAAASRMSSSSWPSPGTTTPTRQTRAPAALSSAAVRAIFARVAGSSTSLPVAFRQRSRSRRGGSMLLLWPMCTSPSPWAFGHHRSVSAFTPECRAVWIQRQIELRARPRGFHLVTDEVVGAVPELSQLAVGIATVFMQHTSASLTLNENASPRRAPRLRRLVRPRRSRRRRLLRAHARGPGRHARPHQGVAHRLVPGDPGRRRLAGARNVAGDLPLRAPRPRRPAARDPHRLRRATG